MTMTAGVTWANESVGNKVWNILGQTYMPKQLTESSFSWFATLPPGTFVPPHYHISQDEFVYVLEGEVVLTAAIDPAIRAGVASIPKGVWRSGTRNGFTANALIPDHVDERGGGACYNDARVQVERVG